MSVKAIGGAVLGGAAIAAACVFALVSLLGSSAPVLAGTAIGLGLGIGGAALEVVLMSRAVRQSPARAMNVVLGGLGARLLVVMVLTVIFHNTASVNETAFALSFVGGFLASLPAVGVVSGARGAARKAPDSEKAVQG